MLRFLLLLMLPVITHAFTATDVANCKTELYKEYTTNCKYASWYVDHWVQETDANCQPGYNEALARCDLGKMWVYRDDHVNGLGDKLKSMSYMRYTGLVYAQIMELSVAKTPGYNTMRQCYQGTVAETNIASPYITTALSCTPDPNTFFQLQIDTQSSWLYNFYPHLAGYSLTDTATSIPYYSCKGTTYFYYPTKHLYTYYFLSFSSTCNGETKLGQAGFANKIL